MSQIKKRDIQKHGRAALTFSYPEGIKDLSISRDQELKAERQVARQKLKLEPPLGSNTVGQLVPAAKAVVVDTGTALVSKELSDDSEPSLEESFADLSKHLSKGQIKYPSYTHNQDYLAVYQETGNRAALELLVEANQRLVKNMAHRYRRVINESISEEDIGQWGYLGLLEAADRYDDKKGAKFSTYATYWIKQMVIKGIKDTRYLVRVPAHGRELIIRITQKEEESEAIFGEIDVGWICHELSITELRYRRLVKARDSFDQVFNINTLIRDGDEDPTIEEQLIDPHQDIEEQLDHEWLREVLAKALDKLTAREEQILRLKFGFDGGESLTLKEIGHIFGVTTERIRQIEMKALKKLAQPEISDMLRDHYYTNGGNRQINNKTGSGSSYG